jgi:hypothetical protein
MSRPGFDIFPIYRNVILSGAYELAQYCRNAVDPDASFPNPELSLPPGTYSGPREKFLEAFLLLFHKRKMKNVLQISQSPIYRLQK